MNRNKGKSLKGRNEHSKDPKAPRILILTDGEKTEKIYFEGLIDHLSEKEKCAISLKVIAKGGRLPSDLLERYREVSFKESYSITAFVFDKDFVPNFDQEVSKLEKEKNVLVGWSNFCFETWLSAYFGPLVSGNTPKECTERFEKIFKEKTKQEYSKTIINLYELLEKYGNEDEALERAEKKIAEHKEIGHRKPSEMNPGTTVYKVIRAIHKKAKKKK